MCAGVFAQGCDRYGLRREYVCWHAHYLCCKNVCVVHVPSEVYVFTPAAYKLLQVSLRRLGCRRVGLSWFPPEPYEAFERTVDLVCHRGFLSVRHRVRPTGMPVVDFSRGFVFPDGNWLDLPIPAGDHETEMAALLAWAGLEPSPLAVLDHARPGAVAVWPEDVGGELFTRIVYRDAEREVFGEVAYLGARRLSREELAAFVV